MSAGPATEGAQPGERERSLATALAFCLVDVALIGTAAFHSNSLVILGDFLKECGDTISVGAAFVTLRAVSRPPSHRFRYGIGKLENLVSMSIVVLTIAGAALIAAQALSHLRHPVTPHGTLPGIAIFTVYAVIGLSLALRNRRLLTTQHSPIIASQAALWFSKGLFDGLMALALTLSLVAGETAWGAYLDPLASLLGAWFMAQAAWRIASSSVADLLDATLDEALQMRILQGLATHFDDYELIHGIRTRRSGSRVYVELFLEFHPDLLMREARQRIDRMRASIQQSIPGADVSICPTEDRND